MKKTVVYIIIAILAVSLAAAALASAAPGPVGPQRGWGPMKEVALTDGQKQEMGQLYQQMLDLRKQIIQKRVEYGQLTREQADWMISRMEERAKYAAENGYSGFGRGMHGGRGPGRGPGPGFCPGAQQNVNQ